MPAPFRATIAALVLLTQPGRGLAQAPAAPAPPRAAAAMASTVQFAFRSTVNGADYQVRVFLPGRPPPPGGYPALYVLDGNALFFSFAEAVRNRSLAGEIAPAIVVGIGGGDGGAGADRSFDFTTHDMTAHEKTLIKDLGPHPRFGGGDGFLRVIQQEIKPRIAALAPADPRRTAIFGWSLGGLFVVQTLFSHPGAFATYLAVSPSLWRTDRAIFTEIPAFERRVAQTRAKPALFLGAGSLEETPRPGLLSDVMSFTELSAALRYCRMVQNTISMAGLLRGYFHAQALAFDSRIFAGDTHNSVVWDAINPLLDFTLPPQAAGASAK